MTDPASKPLTLGVDFRKLLTLLPPGVYGRKEWVVRELIQNATDALVARVIDDPGFSEVSACISLRVDRTLRKLMVQDNGIGMTTSQLEVLLETTGTSAKSLAAALVSSDDSSVRRTAGNFGIGFLSTYAIANTIEILSRPWQRGATGVHVVLDSTGTYTVAPNATAEEPGTSVVLHLNSDGELLLDSNILENVLQTFCAFAKFPIVLDGKRIHQRNATLLTRAIPDLSVRLARVLREAGLSIEAEPAIGGLRPDFLVRGSAGQLVVVEAKTWEASPGYISRAVSQAEHYKTATGADAAFVVLAGAGDEREDEGVVTLDGVVAAIRSALARPRSSTTRKPLSGRDRTIFAAMPFAAAYDDVFFVAMAYAAEQVEATCVRVDQEEFAGDVVTEIQRLVRKSIAVVADLSESRPNVLYEAGYAHALEVPVVHICSTALDALPFDVRNWNTISYVQGQTFKLRERLAHRLRSIVR